MEGATVFTDVDGLLEGNEQYLRLAGRHKADILSRSGIVAKGLPKDFSLIHIGKKGFISPHICLQHMDTTL